MKQGVVFAGKLFGCFLPLFFAYACQLAISVVGMFLYTTWITAKGVALGMSEGEVVAWIETQILNPNFLMTLTAIATVSTILFGVIWYKWHRPIQDKTLKQLCNGTVLLTMLLLGIGLQILVSMCLNVIYPLLPQTLIEQYDTLMETLLGGNIVLSFVVTVVLAPLAEEFLFRGVTLRKATKIMPFFLANILQASLFGIYHGNLIQGIYAFALGLILGYVAEYFHSIWASILLHAFVNGSAELLSHLPILLTETLIGILVITIVGVVCFITSVKLFPKAKKDIK